MVKKGRSSLMFALSRQASNIDIIHHETIEVFMTGKRI